MSIMVSCKSETAVADFPSGGARQCSTPVQGLRAPGWRQASMKAQAWLAVQDPVHCQPREMRQKPAAREIP